MATPHSTRAIWIFISIIFIPVLVTAKPRNSRRTVPLIDTSRIMNDIFPQVEITNVTHQRSSLLADRVGCFDPLPGRPLATIEGCRSVLNRFKTFPDYRRVQDFQTEVYPRKPQPPPFSVHDRDCSVTVKAANPHVVDRFSFEQVRTLAQDIIGDCLDHGGVGGIASIGRGIGWVVTVKGVISERMLGRPNVTRDIHSEKVSS